MKKILLSTLFTLVLFVTSTTIVLAADGSLDEAFFSAEFASGNPATSVSIGDDGKITLAGYFPKGVTRLNADGTLDNTFHVFSFGPDFGAPPLTAITQPDEKILAGGFFSSYKGESAPYIVRILADGTYDASFAAPCAPSCTGTEAGFNNTVGDLALASDGKIIAVGQFTDYRGTPTSKIARINTNGMIDASFVTGTGFDDDVNGVAVQSDGKIIATGDFTHYNGTAANNIIRLNADGSVDSSFSAGAGFDGTSDSNIGAAGLAALSDGKIIVSGTFTSYQGHTVRNIVRLNNDGSYDPGFVTEGVGFYDDDNFSWVVLDVDMQSDGKLIVANDSPEYNGTPVGRLSRLQNTLTPVPTAPTVAPDLTTDDGDSTTDNSTTVTTPTFVGTCAAAETVTLYNGSGVLAPTAVCSSGTYSITLDTPLAVGTYDITATVTDTIGESEKSPVLTLSIVALPAVVETPRNRVIGGGGGSSRTIVTAPVAPVTPVEQSCSGAQLFSPFTGIKCTRWDTSMPSPVDLPVATAATFSVSLRQGMTGPDVLKLQQYLNAHGAPVASSGAGSPGKETTFFGPATRAAVATYQSLNGIVPASGFFGPLTRAFVNK